MAAHMLKPLPLLASAFSLILLVFGGIYIWREYRAAAPEPVVAKQGAAPVDEAPENNSKENPPVAPEVAPTGETPGEETKPGRPAEPTNRQTAPVQPSPRRPSNQDELIAETNLRVDLEDYAVTRGGAAGGKEIKLTGSRLHLILTLPEGSGKGVYNVSVVDESGSSLATSSARSTDGKTLTATLSIQKLPPQKYSLRISREGESPVNVPVVISAGK